jgi:hypothetical protein
MFSDIAVEIFERVEECRFEARKAVHAEDKGAWLALADEWLRLADTLVYMAPELPVSTEQTLVSA